MFRSTFSTMRVGSLRAAACAAAVLCTLVGGARAENHALIMWVGEYADARQNLPGIDKDAALARGIARSMGVADNNIVEVKNRDLTLEGMKLAVGQLVGRVQSGDRVFIYYSGHGGQVDAAGGKCSEGMVAHDGSLYFDQQLQDDLDRLAGKAAQVIFMNDSCFSGGAATKDAGSSSGEVAKSYTGTIKSAGGADGYACGDAVNKMTRSFAERASRQELQVLYIAASSDRELSYASSKGSTATVAWAQCLENAQTDTNRDGFLSGEELRQCAQTRINGVSRKQQTVTLIGNIQLPVGFNTASVTTTPVQPERTLAALRAASDPTMNMVLNLSQTQLSISRRDRLDFSISTPQAGYLYLLHIGSDGKTFDVLFPNDMDTNNYVSAGVHRFPRPKWAVEATGPEGVGYVMAYMSPTPKNFRDGMDKIGPFASVSATRSAASKLAAVAVGSGQSGGGRFGTSDVIPVRETR
ncbi:DUF4384 domain-containing protein [Diaphorobacter sp. HDW4B]|uniref:caspase family protein n=1 Tax=Diaphorobacter sp. HDW4B TaxID=2714925 RepID=UPI00140CC103|nr:caspase family protein [Diaphorobacter sp. HDW4B]QIL73077.1 DUF4384 domain-containing protein [Diaphorobacter sp. HDW4B]